MAQVVLPSGQIQHIQVVSPAPQQHTQQQHTIVIGQNTVSSAGGQTIVVQQPQTTYTSSAGQQQTTTTTSLSSQAVSSSSANSHHEQPIIIPQQQHITIAAGGSGGSTGTDNSGERWQVVGLANQAAATNTTTVQPTNATILQPSNATVLQSSNATGFKFEEEVVCSSDEKPRAARRVACSCPNCVMGGESGISERIQAKSGSSVPSVRKNSCAVTTCRNTYGLIRNRGIR
ncbi:unnamed protein product, partial [Nesidiocoris tenuis]